MHRWIAIAAALLLLMSGIATAAEYASKAEAKQLVAQAIAHFDKVGRDKAMADFNDPNGGFRDRDLYIAVLEFDGTTLAQGMSPKLVGTNRIDQTDANGKYYLRELIEVARRDGEGWVDYLRLNPQTKAVEEKTTFTKQHANLVFICGAYKPS